MQTETKMVAVKDLSDTELANVQAVYKLRNDPDENFNLMLVEREMARRAGKARTDLEGLRDWAAKKVMPKVQAPTEVEEPPTHEEVPEVASVRDRPKEMNEIVGQTSVVNQLKMVIVGATLRQAKVPNILLVGPSGHGKSTLAGVVAHEMGAELISTNGMLLRKTQDLVGLLMKAPSPVCLFIDEVHALPTAVAEVLYEVLEDGQLSTIIGSGGDATAIVHKMEGFVCIAATTRPGVLPAPFRGRFGYVGQVIPYTMEELGEMVHRAWDRIGMAHVQSEAMEVAKRAKGVPRRALHLSERVCDFAAIMQLDKVEEGTVNQALGVFGIDGYGFDANDWAVLEALTTGPFAGGTVGADALSSSLDLDLKTLTDDVEPYLAQAGYIKRTRTGRMALPPAYDLVKEHAAAKEEVTQR